jgi:putative DNA primase/helicase
MKGASMTDTISAYQQGAYQQTTEYGFRDAVIRNLGGAKCLAFSSGTFWKYGSGVWKPVNEWAIRSEVTRELEAASTAGTGFVPTQRMESNVTNAIKPKVYVDEGQWDKRPDILVFGNCALDTHTMARVDHDPAHMATIALPYEYDPKAKAPTWQKVLGDLLGKAERKFFQEFAGYCLTHSVSYQMALWLVGAPGGGKSTLIAGLEAMLGELVGVLGLSQLQGSRFALANVPGKTLLTCTENPSGHIKVTDTLNALITGDTIQVEKKYKDAVSYRNTAKLLWAMNSLPGLYDPNNGLFRRVKIMEIGSIPDGKRDPNVIERVRREGPGITNWALDGLARLNERGGFEYPASVGAASERYKQDNDLPAQFIEERCQRAPSEQLFYTDEYKLFAQKLTDAFNEWARDNGHAGQWSTARLAPDWERLELVKGNRQNKGVPWYGVKLV